MRASVLLLASLAAPLAAAPRALAPVGAPLGGPAAGLARLVVEPAFKGDRFSFLHAEDRTAIEAAVADAGPGARLIRSDGASAIFEGRAFIEADAQASPGLIAALSAAGLRVASLETAVARFEQAAPAAAPASDADLAAVVGRIMDGSRAFDERAEALGSVVALLESDPGALAGRSEEARREASFALYNGLTPMVGAFNAIRGEQRIAARQRWLDAHGGSAGNYVDMELAAHAELELPALRAPVEPFRASVRRVAAAIEAAASKVSVPLLVTLLPHAEHALFEALSAAPARAKALASGWLSMIAESVELTRRLVEDHATAPASRREISLSMSSGGVGGLSQRRVDGHRATLWGHDKESWTFNLGDLRHYIWDLLATSPQAARVIAKGFVELLVDSEPKIAEIDAHRRAEELARAESQFEFMSKGFRSRQDIPDLQKQLDELKRDSLRQAEEQYERFGKIEGQTVLDHALQTLSYYGPYDRLKPGFDEDRYLKGAAALLREAAVWTNLAAFKLVAHTALELVDEARQWAWPRIMGDTKDELNALEREVEARAAAEGLKLFPR